MLKMEISNILKKKLFRKKDFNIQNVSLGNLHSLLILGHPQCLSWIGDTINSPLLLSTTLTSPARKVGTYGSI